MILFLEKLANNIERNLKNTVVAFRIYSVIMILCTVGFYYYGIRPLSRVLRTKIALSHELQMSYDSMLKNLDNAQNAEKVISQNKNAISMLDRYMPVETNVQTYVLDFIDSIGDSGYTLKNFTQDATNISKGQIDLSLMLEGLVYPTNIVKEVEALKRVTQVKRVNVYQNSKGVMTVNLVLTIYTLII